MDRDTLLELIPAYALGALDPDEQAAVEALLATDAEARQLLAEYREISDALVLATPARRAPAHLADDLRQRLTASRGETAPIRAAQATLPRRPVRSTSWVMLGLAAAAAFALVLAGVLLLTRPAPGAVIGAEAETAFLNIAAQPDVQRVPITPVLEGTTLHGELVMTADGTQAVFHVRQLPVIAGDRIFQLWLVDEGGAHSGGLLPIDNPDGSTYVVVPLEKLASDYAAFAVSIEPAGGSPQAGPTGPRVFDIILG